MGIGFQIQAVESLGNNFNQNKSILELLIKIVEINWQKVLWLKMPLIAFVGNLWPKWWIMMSTRLGASWCPSTSRRAPCTTPTSPGSSRARLNSGSTCSPWICPCQGDLMMILGKRLQASQMIKILINNKLQIIINIINVHNPDYKWTSLHASRPLGSFESLSGTRTRWLHVNIWKYILSCWLLYINIRKHICDIVLLNCGQTHRHPWGIVHCRISYVYHAD